MTIDHYGKTYELVNGKCDDCAFSRKKFNLKKASGCTLEDADERPMVCKGLTSPADEPILTAVCFKTMKIWKRLVITAG